MESLHYPRVTHHFQQINTEARRQICKKKRGEKKGGTSCVNWIFPFLCPVCWPKLRSSREFYCVMCSVVLLTGTIGRLAGENGLPATFPFLKVLSDPRFGLLPPQLQDALKCQQCHKQFRSKAGLNYHTMAEHATKVHHMQTWAYLLSCLFLTMIPADFSLFPGLCPLIYHSVV